MATTTNSLRTALGNADAILQTVLSNLGPAGQTFYTRHVANDPNTHIKLSQSTATDSFGYTTAKIRDNLGQDHDFFALKKLAVKERNSFTQNARIVIKVHVNPDVHGNLGMLYATIAHEISVHVVPLAPYIEMIRGNEVKKAMKAIVKAQQPRGNLNAITEHEELARGENQEFQTMVENLATHFSSKGVSKDSRRFNLSSYRHGVRNIYAASDIANDIAAAAKQDIGDHGESYLTTARSRRG